MSKNINITAKACLVENSETNLNEKLKTYNLGIEMNYVVVVIKLLVVNSETKNSNELIVNIVPKVHYVTPFVTKRLAEEYVKELSKENKLMMFFSVDNGKIVTKNEDVEEFINKI